MTGKRVAQGLGWFSLALGILEITMARQLSRGLGVSDSLLRVYGVREIVTGVGVLASSDRTPWLAARVAGVALDIATLAAALPGNERKANVGLALGAVAGVTTLDIAAVQDYRSQRRARYLPRDYSDRSGFPRPPEEMRGAASAARRTKPSSPRAAAVSARP
jgi:hypothetical protein